MSYCFPFLAPFMTAEKRDTKKNIVLILCFTFGRFLGYMIFGFLFGYLGEKLQSSTLTLLADISLILISILLILHITGLYKQKETPCLAQKFQNHNAISMGFLMGINICPPFLLSLSYVFSLHNTIQGILYFLIFFISSSIYFLPLIFVGMLAKIKEFQTVARLSGIICGIIFIIYGCYSIMNHFVNKH